MNGFNNALSNLSGGLGASNVEWVSNEKVYIED